MGLYTMILIVLCVDSCKFPARMACSVHSLPCIKSMQWMESAWNVQKCECSSGSLCQVGRSLQGLSDSGNGVFILFPLFSEATRDWFISVSIFLVLIAQQPSWSLSVGIMLLHAGLMQVMGNWRSCETKIFCPKKATGFFVYIQICVFGSVLLVMCVWIIITFKVTKKKKKHEILK